ncbi:four helix bundle suffix domain-containing protein [Patescibacteria group bacterium]
MKNSKFRSPQSPLSPSSGSRAGYEYLLAYKITIPIYDYTVEFCRRCKSPNYPHFPDLPSYRSHDQMVQAARSGTQNIAEGYKQQGLKGYIKLSGINRGSLEELLKDFLAYARQNKIPVWPKEKARKIREIGEIWAILRKHQALPDSPNFPNLPNDREAAVNLMITLINQANYLIDKLIPALKHKHKTQGGFTEKLYRERKNHRGY